MKITKEKQFIKQINWNLPEKSKIDTMNPTRNSNKKDDKRMP